MIGPGNIPPRQAVWVEMGETVWETAERLGIDVAGFREFCAETDWFSSFPVDTEEFEDDGVTVRIGDGRIIAARCFMAGYIHGLADAREESFISLDTEPKEEK